MIKKPLLMIRVIKKMKTRTTGIRSRNKPGTKTRVMLKLKKKTVMGGPRQRKTRLM